MKVKKPMSEPEALRQFETLKTTLAQTGWISEGYVQNRGPGAGGPCFQWTRKVKGKTVSVALSEAQYNWLKTAIENWKTIQSTLKQMQCLSRCILFETIPGVKRSKPLTKKTMGLN